MIPTTLDLYIYRGDDYFHQLMFTDDAEPPEPLDLSGYLITAQIRDRPENGGIVLAEFNVDNSNSAIGILNLILSDDETRIRPGYWDLQFDTGAPGGKTTWLKGTVRMQGDVTQEIPEEE